MTAESCWEQSEGQQLLFASHLHSSHMRSCLMGATLRNVQCVTGKGTSNAADSRGEDLEKEIQAAEKEGGSGFVDLSIHDPLCCIACVLIRVWCRGCACRRKRRPRRLKAQTDRQPTTQTRRHPVATMMLRSRRHWTEQGTDRCQQYMHRVRCCVVVLTSQVSL